MVSQAYWDGKYNVVPSHGFTEYREGGAPAGLYVGDLLPENSYNMMLVYKIHNQLTELEADMKALNIPIDRDSGS